jgi:acyl-CoA reductase-like NAD-dependent aldehyde dehydrogenase
MAVASGTVKRLCLELGGKNPLIVMEDADLDKAAEKAVAGQYNNSGQLCAAPGRIYVHESLYDEFNRKFVEGSRKMVVGDPQDKNTEMGPLVSAEHRDDVEAYIASGISEGATLLHGGRRPTGAPLDRGCYVMPTVFADVTQDMKIARKEIFGPVACILKFSAKEEVIKAANDSPFGLCAGIFSKDIPRAIRMSSEIQAGTVWINDYAGLTPDMPWGGFKESGFGKENSMVGLEEYTQLKVISLGMQ